MPLEIKTEIQDGVNVIYLKGEMDSVVTPDFEDTVKTIMDNGQYHLVIELGELIYLDSSGIGSIIRALRTATKYGGSLKIAAANSAIETIFDVTRLREIIDFYPDLPSALESFDKK